MLAERTAVTPRVAPYRPGEFYLRELRPLRAVPAGLGGLGLEPGPRRVGTSSMMDAWSGLSPAR